MIAYLNRIEDDNEREFLSDLIVKMLPWIDTDNGVAYLRELDNLLRYIEKIRSHKSIFD